MNKIYVVLYNSCGGELGSHELRPETKNGVFAELSNNLEVGDVIKIEERWTEE